MAYVDPSSAPSHRPSPPANDALPPVEPPSAGFLVQLFLVPGLIVAVIVVVWLLVDWVAHMEADPKQYVESLRRDSKDSFQKAYNLADMLHSDRSGELRNNAELASQLGSILNERLEAGKTDEQSVQLRFYLAEALGEFNTPEGAPTLVKAMADDKEEKNLVVREGAIEGLGKLILNVRKAHPEQAEKGPLAQPQVLDALLTASRDPNPVIRLRAASVLGVLGGKEAVARLTELLDDPSGDVELNAATGLARQGSAAGLNKLVAMLSPTETEFLENDPKDQQEDKRQHIMLNGLLAIETLVDSGAKFDRAAVEPAVHKLTEPGIPLPIRDAALRVVGKLGKDK